jgi:DNA-binding helix-hairpin-helix protein with protein kinase domain
MIVLLTRASNNQPVSLTQQIASSGEGEVWETNLSGHLAKIYHNATTERIEKLKVMLANPPVDPMISFNHISIAWVSDLLKDSSGNYVGFLMPAIRNSKQLSSIYNPSRRKKIAPGFNWYYLHVTALNTAWIIQEIHAKGYVLGDIKTENILVNDRALVAVIDTDSFQVPDSQTGKIYRCTVGSEGFTPVELLGKDIATTNQTETHDRFRLAVLIHYLLFGYHPFSGQWIGSGEPPEQTELIRKGYWYAGQNSLIRPSQNTIPLNVVHPEIKKLFLQCFNEGQTQPHLRPTAKDWHDALQVAVNELTVCGRVDSHHYSRHYGKCYWCERAATLGVDIFPGVVGTATIPSTTTQTISPPKSSNQTSIKLTSSYSNQLLLTATKQFY